MFLIMSSFCLLICNSPRKTLTYFWNGWWQGFYIWHVHFFWQDISLGSSDFNLINIFLGSSDFNLISLTLGFDLLFKKKPLTLVITIEWLLTNLSCIPSDKTFPCVLELLFWHTTTSVFQKHILFCIFEFIGCNYHLTNQISVAHVTPMIWKMLIWRSLPNPTST